MSWKPALIAAVIVVAAGFAVGVAIGGKEKTVTKTETVVREVASADSTPATTPATPPTETTPEGDPGPELAGEPQFLSESDADPITTNLYFEPGPGTIDAETFQDSVKVYDLFSDEAGPAYLEYAVEGNREFEATVGFDAKKTPASMKVTLSIRKDDARGEELWKGTFSGSSKGATPRVSTEGASKLVFVFTLENDPDSFDYPDHEFVLGDAHFTP